ncbi:MAG: hypothetical protein J1F32_06620 [Erysipelotrichales bacterium]|nr:hypothetical protein [Erysipelotrichales bacterium]
MKKKLLFALLCSSLLVSCGFGIPSTPSSTLPSNQGSVSTSETQDIELPEIAKEFIDAVNSLKFDDNMDYAINEAYNLYDLIDDYTWNNFPEVQEAFYKLEMLEQIYFEYIRDKNIADDFIAKVDAIPYFLSLEDERYIIAAEAAYENIINKDIIGISEAYEKLLNFREQFDRMFLEAQQKSLEEEIASFLEVVAKLPEVENLTLNDKDLITAAENAYEYISFKAKEDNRVIEAKTLIDQLKERYEELLEHPELADEAIINAFVSAINSIDDVTLNNGSILFRAKDLYHSLQVESKALNNVKESYEKMMNYLDDYFALYVEVNGKKETQTKVDNTQELVDRFVELVDEIPSVDSITQDDGESIAEAEKYYDSLTLKALARNEVKESYAKLQDARVKLNTYLTNSLPLNAKLLFSGDTIQHVVLQSQTPNFYDDIKSLYGVGSYSDLKDKASMYLYVYKSNTSTNYIAKINVSDFLYAGNMIITGSTIVERLEALSAFDKTLNKNRFCFGLQIEDRSGLYKESELKKSSISNNIYPFTNIYNDNADDETTIFIHSTEEFLEIKNNSYGNYVLENDIDLAGIEWENLGEFFGTLDGNGHTIKNISSTQGLDAKFGLFLEVKANAVVQDLVLEGRVENAGSWAGAIAVRNYGTISNCLINLDISSSTQDGHIGGIVCENQGGGVIENCIVLSKINGSSMDGGICVGQYGKVTNTYFLSSNVSTGKAVGNSNALNNCKKTSEELKTSSLYDSFDKKIWCSIDGFYPTLVRY